MQRGKDLRNTIFRIEALIQEFNATGAAIPQNKVLELVQMLLDYHGAGISRMIDVISHCPAAATVQQNFVDDDLIASLLLLYGQHPEDPAQRLKRALMQLNTLFAPQQGSVELISNNIGTVKINYRGNSQGCSWTEIKQTIEQAIYNAVPEAELVEVIADVSSTPKLVQLSRAKSIKGM